MRHKKNLELQKDITDLEICCNVYRKLVGDEDKCNKAIKAEIEKGPPRIRVLTREELKIEIRKYKNIVKEAASGSKMEGLKIEKDSKQENFDGESSMFDVQSELPADEEIPEKVQERLDKLDDANQKLTLEIKDKNEKILELLGELEEIKI